MLQIFLAYIVFAVFLLQGCTLLQFKRLVDYDSRNFYVVTVSLFDQRSPPLKSEYDWKADWLFRRQRLELLDEEIYKLRPDLIFFQQLMARRGSPSESDQNILSFGSLDSYQWTSHLVRTYEDTQEDRYLAVAAGLPFKMGGSKPQISMRELGVDGFVAASQVDLEGQPILAVNLELPSSVNSAEAWYQVVEEFIKEQLKFHGICEQRLIVGGFFSGRPGSEYYDSFIKNLGLKDTAEGYCELATDCATSSSSSNDLLAASEPSNISYQSDRILVSRHTVVYSGSVVFQNIAVDAEEFKRYGIEKIQPTRRFGWGASIRIPLCGSSN